MSVKLVQIKVVINGRDFVVTAPEERVDLSGDVPCPNCDEMESAEYSAVGISSLEAKVKEVGKRGRIDPSSELGTTTVDSACHQAIEVSEISRYCHKCHLKF